MEYGAKERTGEKKLEITKCRQLFKFFFKWKREGNGGVDGVGFNQSVGFMN